MKQKYWLYNVQFARLHQEVCLCIGILLLYHGFPNTEK